MPKTGVIVVVAVVAVVVVAVVVVVILRCWADPVREAVLDPISFRNVKTLMIPSIHPSLPGTLGILMNNNNNNNHGSQADPLFANISRQTDSSSNSSMLIKVNTSPSI